MNGFNTRSRTQNVLRASAAGVLCNFGNLLAAFVYQTVFIRLLSVNYLGINGVFGNVLNLLSLAELGIASSITYHIYGPISRGDREKVGQLMHFFEGVYRLVAMAVFVLGISLLPFLDMLIKNPGEVPGDIHLRWVYILYLIQSASSYLFVSRQMLLMADQRYDRRAFLQSGTKIAAFLFQILSLLLWRSFTVTLVVGIGTTMVCNLAASAWVSGQYREVFSVRSRLSKPESRRIIHDIIAGGCHRIGSVILNGTDHLVLSRFVGLVASGMYANYLLVFSGLKAILRQLLGNCTASFGSARAELDDARNDIIYMRMVFANLAITGFSTFCLYGLIHDFIGLWLNKSMQLSHGVVVVLCIQFFMDTGRIITDAYIHGVGLFTRDRLRPFLEAGLNVALSILFVLRLGIAGVFLGTILSFGLTGFWRAPYLIFRYSLKRSSVTFWKMYLSIAGFTFLCCAAVSAVPFHAESWLAWLGKGILLAMMYLAGFTAVFWKKQEFRFFREMLQQMAARARNRKI